MYREDCATPSPLRTNCAKRLQQPKTGRLGVWTNHVKISVVASENALQPNEPLQVTRAHSDWGMATAWSARWRVAWGGEVTVYI